MVLYMLASQLIPEIVTWIYTSFHLRVRGQPSSFLFVVHDSQLKTKASWLLATRNASILSR